MNDSADAKDSNGVKNLQPPCVGQNEVEQYLCRTGDMFFGV